MRIYVHTRHMRPLRGAAGLTNAERLESCALSLARGDTLPAMNDDDEVPKVHGVYADEVLADESPAPPTPPTPEPLTPEEELRRAYYLRQHCRPWVRL